MAIEFPQVQSFLESWGLHFHTPDGESSDIPYPQIYVRMCNDAKVTGGLEFRDFMSRITDTIDGRTYLAPNSWDEIEASWFDFNNPGG